MKSLNKYILILLSIFSFISSTELVSQIYVPISQNRDWNTDSELSTYIIKNKDVDVTVTPSLKMLLFADAANQNNTYGWRGAGAWSDPLPINDIPAGWDYEILTEPGWRVPNNVTIAQNKKSFTYSGSQDQEVSVFLKITDANNNDVSNLGAVPLKFYIRGNFTVASSRWNTCEQVYVISVNEKTVEGSYPCRPYSIVVYKEVNGVIDEDNVIYESTLGGPFDTQAGYNTWKIANLQTGNYAAKITNSCGERVTVGDSDWYKFSITDTYTFGSSLVFAGFECLTDTTGTAIIKIEGAAIPVEWTLTNTDTNTVILTNEDNDSYSTQGFVDDPDFATQNYTVTIPNLQIANYRFFFKDDLGCDDTLDFEVKEPLPIDANLVEDESKLALDCYGDSDGKLTFIAEGGWTEPWEGNTVNPDPPGVWGAPYTFTLTKNGQNLQSGAVNAAFNNLGNQIGYKTSFTGLSAGDYTLTVRENIATNPYEGDIVYFCSKIFEDVFTITEPPELVVTGDIISNNGFGVSCNNGEDGKIDLSVSGGTPDYTYAWTKVGDADYSANTQDIEGLTPGTYKVVVTDANDCEEEASFEITEPVELAIEYEVDDASIPCYDGDGNITVTITGDSNGNGPNQDYTYNLTGTDYNGEAINVSVSKPQLTHIFTVKAGTYTVNVTDANGCSVNEQNIEFTQPDAPITIDGAVTSLECFGDDDGVIDITVQGGTAPYSYSWTGPNNFTADSEDINTLQPGSYTVIVTDAENCTLEATFEVTEPDELIATLTNSNNISCNSGNDGSITISVSGGTADYTYAWTKQDDNNYSADTQNIENLTAGTYNLLITDANGCEETLTHTLTEPDELLIEDEGLDTAIACFDNNGQIQINITQASVADYTYNLTGTDYLNQNVDISVTKNELSHTFTPKAGTYKVTVTDANGCEKETNNITLTQPNAGITISDSTVTNVICFNQGNGEIDITVEGGTPNYTYQWTKDDDNNFSENTQDLTNLSPGIYNVRITDNSGCFIDEEFEITQPDLLEVKGTSSSISCFDADDGSITLNPTGGTAPYSYSWSTNDGGVGLSVNEKDQSELGPGTYTVVITDANNCTDDQTFVITEPDEIDDNEDIPQSNGFEIFPCNGDDNGSITVNPTGGTAPYSYAWTGPNGFNSTNQNIVNLEPGAYTLVITDANNCRKTFNYSLDEPDAINAEISGTDISEKGGQDGSITINNLSGGFLNNGDTYQFNWSTNVQDSGIVQGNKNQVGLRAGTYTVTITDSMDCEKILQITLNEPEELLLTFQKVDVRCFGEDNGSIDLTISGGIQPYTIVWSSHDGGTGLDVNSEDQSGLGPGTFNVTVTDANNISKQGSVVINEPDVLEISLENDGIPEDEGYQIFPCNGDSNGSIDIAVTGGNGNYTYTWSTNNGDGLVQGQQDQQNLTAGTYFVTVKDAKGCEVTETYILTEPDPINISAVISSYPGGTEISGKGRNDGSIDITVTGGVTEYTFLWTTNDGDGLVPNSEDQTNLTAGTYTVLVTDKLGCTSEKVYRLSEPEAISFNSTISSFGNFNISCFNANDGWIDITPSGGNGNYTYIWSTNNGSGLTDGTQDQSGLGPGTYSLTLKDSNNNEISDNFILVQPDQLILDESELSDYNGFEVSCFGGSDGEIRLVNITGGHGEANRTYSWVGPNGFTSNSRNISNLIVGEYTVTITDSYLDNNTNDTGSCEIKQSFTLESPEDFTFNFTKRDYNGFNVSCNGDSDGGIDITVSGGYLDPGSDYVYSWTGPNGFTANTEDILDIKAGSYSVTFTDDNGCSNTETIELSEPESLDITAELSDYNGFQISIAGENDGSIDITVTGGTSEYTYLWSTLDGSGLNINSEDQTSLTAGTYTVTVTDTNGCVIEAEYELIEPKELICDIDHDAYKNDVLCYGDATASIKMDITQASIGPYTYTINGTTYLNENYSQSFDNISELTYTFTNLTAGEYVITITDANGAICGSAVKEIRGPDNPLSITGETTNVTCNGAADGTIDITVAGGGGSSNQFTYFYSWTTQDGSGLDPAAEDQTGLGPGTYTVVVTDINDCSITESFTITQSPPLTYNLDSIKNITCNGDNDGEINITVTGGTGNYSYEWLTENGSGIQQGEQDQIGLGPGDYKLILRDGCNTFEYIYEITTPDTLEINLDEKVNILCHDASTGAIGVTVIGGTLPYNYVWKDNFGNVYDRDVGNVFNKGDLSNIPAGIYELTVTDANNCVATFTTELTQPEDLVIDIETTDLNCFNSNDGSITVTPSGGVAPYSYTWSDFGNGNVRNGLSAGSYTVTITDSNGCEEVREIEIENAELFDVDPTVTPVSCFGANDGSIEMNFEGGVAPISFTWSDDSTAGQNRYNLSPGLYSVLIKDASGCEIQRDFTIIEPQEISITGVLTDAIDCDNPASGSIDLQVSGGNAPYTYQWSNGATTEDISGLIANNYLVKVTDSKGCTAEKEFVINRQDDLVISLDTSLYAICETKEVYQKNIVSVSGGVAPYTIEWSNGLVTGNNGEIMDTKIEGTYQVTVTDYLGCSESIVFEVETPTIGSPDFDYTSFYLTTFNALAVNDPITFNNLSTEQYFSSFWDFGDGNTSNETNPTHTYTRRGVYDVTLTVEFILGCSYSITKTIFIGDQYEIVIPNAFTPNNDTFNDTFRPIYYGFTYIYLQVFDTWGTLIYSEESTSNELNGWDGKINGQNAENGNYFYQVSGVTFTEDTYTKNGAFTLLK